MMMVRFQLAAVGGETRTNIYKKKQIYEKYNEKWIVKYNDEYKKKRSDQI